MQPSRTASPARNSRTHSDEQVAQVAASIRERGWTNPVLIAEDGTIIAGHASLRPQGEAGASHECDTEPLVSTAMHSSVASATLQA